MRRTGGWAMAVAAASLIVAGCGSVGTGTRAPTVDAGGAAEVPSASPGPSGSSDSLGDPGLSTTDLPTLRPPVAPPSAPTDIVGGVWVLGTVTQGGQGPCVGFVTDDGENLALYGPDTEPLTAGTRVRVLVRSPRDREVIDCGAAPVRVLMMVKPAG